MPRPTLLTPEELREFIDFNYPELVGCQMSIGLIGDTYRIVVVDQCHVLHTFHIKTAAARADVLQRAKQRRRAEVALEQYIEARGEVFEGHNGSIADFIADLLHLAHEKGGSEAVKSVLHSGQLRFETGAVAE